MNYPVRHLQVTYISKTKEHCTHNAEFLCFWFILVQYILAYGSLLIFLLWFSGGRIFVIVFFSDNTLLGRMYVFLVFLVLLVVHLWFILVTM